MITRSAESIIPYTDVYLGRRGVSHLTATLGGGLSLLNLGLELRVALAPMGRRQRVLRVTPQVSLNREVSSDDGMMTMMTMVIHDSMG